MPDKKNYCIAMAALPLIFTAMPVLAQPNAGAFSFGFSAGSASSITKEAIEGFGSSKFDGGSLLCGSAAYTFPGGFTLELSISRAKMELEEVNDEYGTLELTPTLLLLKYQERPDGGVGMGYHGEIGGGSVSAKFVNGNVIDQIERFYGVRYTIETESSFFFELGGGFDYFLSKNVSLTADGRLLAGNTKTSWRVSGPAGSLTVPDFEKFFSSHFQFMAGLRVWIPTQ